MQINNSYGSKEILKSASALKLEFNPHGAFHYSFDTLLSSEITNVPVFTIGPFMCHLVTQVRVL